MMLDIWLASFLLKLLIGVISLDIKNNNYPHITATDCLQSAFPGITSVYITAQGGRQILLGPFSSIVDELLRLRGARSACQSLWEGCGG